VGRGGEGEADKGAAGAASVLKHAAERQLHMLREGQGPPRQHPRWPGAPRRCVHHRRAEAHRRLHLGPAGDGQAWEAWR
jgi:hypothetical protein